MTGKKGKNEVDLNEKQINAQQENEAAEESSETEANETAKGEELSELEAAKQDWEKEKEELLDRIMRKQADLDNLRRISKMEQAEAREYALFNFLSRLIPVLDNIERALDSARSAKELPASYIEGLEMILKQLEQILEQEGVTVIEAKGTTFDPHCHHAVMEVDSDENEPGIVAEELQKGYRHRQRILRPSMVKVCK
jgi:molecular chaperone GrpE